MPKYKGTFNWYNSNYTFWTHSPTKSKARYNFFLKLSNKVGYSVEFIVNYFCGHEYKIEEVNGKEV